MQDIIIYTKERRRESKATHRRQVYTLSELAPMARSAGRSRSCRKPKLSVARSPRPAVAGSESASEEEGEEEEDEEEEEERRGGRSRRDEKNGKKAPVSKQSRRSKTAIARVASKREKTRLDACVREFTQKVYSTHTHRQARASS